MGWQAIATTYFTDENDYDPLDRKDPLIQEFIKGAEEIKQKYDNVDGMFCEGRLHLTSCRLALQSIIDDFDSSKSCYSDGMNSEYIKSLVGSGLSIKDLFDNNPNYEYTYTVIKFLEICVENDLGIRFSY